MTPLIEERLKALCVAIAEDSELQGARSKAEAFLADEEGVDLYRELMTKSREMQHRQHDGEEIADEDVQELVELKHAADHHAGIKSFHEAQDVLQGVAEMVSAFVSKTLESGEVPTKEEVMNQGGCGEGCGCHH
ncbi:MAG: YlbF family regulator [Verrucomicrobiaceae bacterium]|nr:YlbF family regulator [Verrucomicrobiaceae bacterium]